MTDDATVTPPGQAYAYLVVPAYTLAAYKEQTGTDAPMHPGEQWPNIGAAFDPAALTAATLNRYGAQGWRLVAVDAIVAQQPPYLILEKGPGQ